MPRILVIFFLFLVQSGALAAYDLEKFEGTYKVSKNIWCNGPSSGEAGCWPYGWQQVDLNKLAEMKVERLQSTYYLTLLDNLGNTWTSNFTPCSASQNSNCNATQKDQSLTIDLDVGDNSLTVVVEKNQIMFFPWMGQLNSLLAFTFSKN